MSQGVLGVLGGMGAHTTPRFMEDVIELTDVEKDQDHIEMSVVHDPTIPDRTRAIIGEGEDPVSYLRDDVRKLDEIGADLIAVPCNTFHYFHSDVQSITDTRVIHMIDEVVKYLEEIGIDSVGLLATDGTITSGLYHDPIKDAGIEIHTPECNDDVMDAIYRIKAGEEEIPRRKLMNASEQLLSRDAEKVIAGCTEIELVLGHDIDHFVHPGRIMAKECVTELIH